MHDRESGTTTTLASVPVDGTYESVSSFAPALSADGRYVAFHSAVTNLVAGDTNGKTDVFVYDRQSGETTRVSVASDGTQGDADSSRVTDFPPSAPALSADGRYVAFRSAATNLVAGDTNGAPDVFVHDRQSGETTLVSVATDGTPLGGETPALSVDGRYVAFGRGAAGIWVHDRQSGETTLVSVATDGTPLGGETPTLSADGRYVAFQASSGIYVHDRESGTTSPVSVALDGTTLVYGSSPALSGGWAGRCIRFQCHDPGARPCQR